MRHVLAQKVEWAQTEDSPRWGKSKYSAVVPERGRERPGYCPVGVCVDPTQLALSLSFCLSVSVSLSVCLFSPLYADTCRPTTSPNMNRATDGGGERKFFFEHLQPILSKLNGLDKNSQAPQGVCLILERVNQLGYYWSYTSHRTARHSHPVVWSLGHTSRDIFAPTPLNWYWKWTTLGYTHIIQSNGERESVCVGKKETGRLCSRKEKIPFLLHDMPIHVNGSTRSLSQWHALSPAEFHQPTCGTENSFFSPFYVCFFSWSWQVRKMRSTK